jgi:predicted pyridoxine 5'-phosphate oxidase superfamily flavin-nucleotide-binding protein
MAKVFDQIGDGMRAFIEAQPVFFVATAPNGPGGHVNVSPKGGRGLFRVTGPLGFAYVDLVGSGVETIAHLRENGRITVMFAAFEGPPKIVRLHGSGRVLDADEDRLAGFDVSAEQRGSVRSVIEVDVERVSDSCGFVVPRMDYVGERDQLYRWSDNRVRKQGPGAMRDYMADKNAESLDGLPGLGEPTRAG